ncbi:glycoside hydrolase family 128 protein [Stipitochalara longipes BDJ]|nr:glycoside hydrolase family 128 protein [Stipitochalara longipes BDJ]
MRCSISTVAVAVSSLLVKEAFAGRFDVRKRDLYVVTDAVIVTEEVTVYDYGTSTSTGAALAVATFTSDGVPVIIPAASSPPAPTSTEAPAVLIQQTPESSAPAPVPTTSTTPVPVVVPATTEAPAVVPTTLVPVVSSAAKAVSVVVSAAVPVVTSTGSTTTSSGAKRGLAYNDVSLLSGFASSKAISWAYNWGSSTGTIPSSFEYVPLLWGMASSFTSGWNAAATKAIASGSTHLMSFNEPDLNTQSNLSPAAAAAGYKQYLQPFAGKAQLGSPAVTNGGGSMGLTWLGNFLDACTDCQIDFVCIHWYNGGDAAAFMDYVDQAYTAGGNRPLWITEFQGEGDTAAQNSFLETVIPQLDASSKVARYAYFMASDGNLLSSGTSLSALGTTFAFAG